MKLLEALLAGFFGAVLAVLAMLIYQDHARVDFMWEHIVAPQLVKAPVPVATAPVGTTSGAIPRAVEVGPPATLPKPLEVGPASRRSSKTGRNE